MEITGRGIAEYRKALDDQRIKPDDYLTVTNNHKYLDTYIIEEGGSLNPLSVLNKKTDLSDILSRRRWRIEVDYD